MTILPSYKDTSPFRKLKIKRYQKYKVFEILMKKKRQLYLNASSKLRLFNGKYYIQKSIGYIKLQIGIHPSMVKWAMMENHKDANPLQKTNLLIGSCRIYECNKFNSIGNIECLKKENLYLNEKHNI